MSHSHDQAKEGNFTNERGKPSVASASAPEEAPKPQRKPYYSRPRSERLLSAALEAAGKEGLTRAELLLRISELHGGRASAYQVAGNLDWAVENQGWIVVGERYFLRQYAPPSAPVIPIRTPLMRVCEATRAFEEIAAAARLAKTATERAALADRFRDAERLYNGAHEACHFWEGYTGIKFGETMRHVCRGAIYKMERSEPDPSKIVCMAQYAAKRKAGGGA